MGVCNAPIFAERIPIPIAHSLYANGFTMLRLHRKEEKSWRRNYFILFADEWEKATLNVCLAAAAAALLVIDTNFLDVGFRDVKLWMLHI